MELLSLVAAVLLTLLGFSCGAVLGTRGRAPLPRLVDLGLVLVLFAAVLALRPAIGKWWTLLLGVGIGLAVGTLVSTFRGTGQEATPSPDLARPEHGKAPQSPWRSFLLEMGNVQGRLIMGFFYFLMVTPFALILRLTSDPLDRSVSRDDGDHWSSRPAPDADLDRLRRQS